MLALRLPFRTLAAGAVVSCLCLTAVQADIPVDRFPVATAPDDATAPFKVTIAPEAGAQARLVIPRKLAERAGAIAREASAPPAKSSLPAIMATMAGGGAISLGVLLLGIYLIRRSNRRAQTAVAGTVAAIALFVGAGVVFADLLPFSNGPRPPRGPVEPDLEQPTVTIVIVEEGDTIELTLPKSLVNAAR